jgi:hypothetical protein
MQFVPPPFLAGTQSKLKKEAAGIQKELDGKKKGVAEQQAKLEKLTVSRISLSLSLSLSLSHSLSLSFSRSLAL